MKKSLLYLILFCLVLCMICTACAKIPAQNTDGSQTTSGSVSTSDSESTSESASTSDFESTSESASTSSSQLTSATDETSATTTEYRKPYEVCYTEIRETKALATEVPELQEKIDRNYEKQGDEHKFQNKVIIQIGDQRDVPYVFEMGGGQLFYHEYIIYPYFAGNPYWREMQEVNEYIPTYTYTGTEDYVIEVNDEIYSTDYSTWYLDVSYLKGEEVMWASFDTLEEMYAALPKGQYYINFHLTVYGNNIFGEKGNFITTEHTFIVPVFIIELK